MKILTSLFLKRLASVMVVLSTLLLLSCATPSLKMDLKSNSKINTAGDGQSFSVLIRFYQLNDPSLFERADYDSLWRDASGILGITLVDEKELMVEPNTQLSISLTKHQTAEYLGIVAYFREHQSAGWKAYRKLNHGLLKADTRMKVEIDGNQLVLGYQ